MKRQLRLGLILFLALGGIASADQPPILECPWYPAPSAESFGLRAFYVPSYQGTSLKQVTLYIAFPAAGAYTLALQARSGGFGAANVSRGRATVSVNVPASTLDFQSVTFDFGTAPVPQGSTLTFETQTVSRPSGVTVQPKFEILTSPSCPVVETEDSAAPLSSFRHYGVAVRITGDAPALFTRTITFPSVASIHGANSTFFHSDVWLVNAGIETLNVTARYRCGNGQNCGKGSVDFALARGQKTIPDVVQTLFTAPETAGALELTYSTRYNVDSLVGFSRVYTPSLPSPTNGASLQALASDAATGWANFQALANNGGDRSAGFRSNAGVYNPNSIATDVTFILTYFRAGVATSLGQVTQSWAPFEWRQINDIFALVGAGSEVTTDALLFVSSTLPVLPYVTVIDNQSGDSIFLPPTTLPFDHLLDN